VEHRNCAMPGCTCDLAPSLIGLDAHITASRHVKVLVREWVMQREVVISNDKPRNVAYRYIIEASIDVS
jgi:hypothetical protein